jgi:hypothetical protein
MVELFGIEMDATFLTAVTAVFTALTALATTVLSLITYDSFKRNMDASKSQMLLTCMNHYIQIQKDRTKAIIEKKSDYVREYYREMFDLHWTEFQLWNIGYIDDERMKPWLKLRHKDFDHDYILIDDQPPSDKLTYKQVWNELLDANYFSKNGLFATFMDYAHSNDVEEALALKRRKRE